VAAVEQVARGRVWSGQQAKERGLVDQLGTLRQAIDSAARIAGLGSDYQVEYAEPALSHLESLLLDMTGSSVSWIGSVSRPTDWMNNTQVEQLLGDLRLFSASGNGLTLAAHCLCRAP
jgi:protease-4